MLAVLSFILSPIIWIMGFFLELYTGIFGSVGLSVMLLACTFTIISWPLQKYGKNVEGRLQSKISTVDRELAPFKGELKGEALFNETERIYKKHNYHPIQSIGLSMSFVVVLPILISAVILLTTHQSLEGQSFLFVSDLSEPDRLLGGLNLLPILMSAIAVFDAFFRFSDDPKSRNRFLVISLVLFVLVYSLPAALVIYWTTNLLVSFAFSFRK